MRKIIGLLLVLLSLGAVRAAEDPAHEELRILRNEIIAAITKGDIDSVLTHIHPDAVVTWQNSEVCRGRQGLKDFFERMGKNSFKGYKVTNARRANDLPRRRHRHFLRRNRGRIQIVRKGL